MTKQRQCRECGAPFAAAKKTGKVEAVAYAPRRFCSTECRKAFNNRRAMRGAEAYDLLRAMRRERTEAKEMNLWTAICRLEEKWQAEDDHDRPGRRSYIPPSEAVMQLVDAGKISRRMTPNEEKAIQERAIERSKAHYKEATP